MLDFVAQYEAFQRRDSAFDGVVFVAVKTTGIYCRSVCRVRTPLAHNVEFYPSAAAAERFRSKGWQLAYVGLVLAPSRSWSALRLVRVRTR